MPWFAIDDGFDTHPKVRKAGNAAAGLFCRLGAFSARHSTDGRVDGFVARSYGTAAQLAKLVAVGLLHDAPHNCDPKHCPQPPKDGYALHDYLYYNRSRAQVEAAREAGRRRQQKGRDAQAKTKTEPQPKPTRNSPEVQVKPGWDSDDPQNESRFTDNAAGQEGSSRRDTLQGATAVPSPPIPSPGTSYGGTSSPQPPATGNRLPALFDAEEDEGQPSELKQLVRAMHAQGMDVSWPLSATDWHQLREQISCVGIHALVEHAARAWQAAKTPPYSARYFLTGWLALQPAPAGQPTGLRALGGPSKTSSYLEDMAAIADEMRQKGTGS